MLWFATLQILHESLYAHKLVTCGRGGGGELSVWLPAQPHTLQFEQCAYYAAVSVPYEFERSSTNLKYAHWFATAGFGVFAGRAFKQGDMLPVSWKTLFLPENFPNSQVLRNYVFGHNQTHIALVLDYGSVLNHHESANVHAISDSQLAHVLFEVRMGFVCGTKLCIHTYIE